MRALRSTMARFEKKIQKGGSNAMVAFRFVLVIALVALTARSQQNSPQEPSAQPQPVPPASCPITRRPAKDFIPPVPYERDENSFWLGTEKLWTFLPERAIWEWAPHQLGHEQEVQPLTAKIFWMRLGYDSRAEQRPAIKVRGRRLDGPAPPLLVLPPTNAFQGPGSAMLTGVYVPTPGCWEITGDYHGNKLSFVVWCRTVLKSDILKPKAVFLHLNRTQQRPHCS
jgi:hypothetical protein